MCDVIEGRLLRGLCESQSGNSVIFISLPADNHNLVRSREISAFLTLFIVRDFSLRDNPLHDNLCLLERIFGQTA
jgi:hypothetical protein